jgi:hypothetical protein
MEQQKEYTKELETRNFSSIEDLYKSITKEGSLGLLALGALGLRLWRGKRSEPEQKEIDTEIK